jgi:hypothetical protein
VKKIKSAKIIQRESISRIINQTLKGTRLRVLSGEKGGPFKLVIGNLKLKSLWTVIEYLRRAGIFK